MEAEKINPFKLAVNKLSPLDPQKPIPVILLYCDCVPATFNTCIIIVKKISSAGRTAYNVERGNAVINCFLTKMET